MGDIIDFPHSGRLSATAAVAETEAIPDNPPPIPSDESIMEFDYHAKRVTEWGAIDGEDFWENIDAIKELIDKWSRA